MTLLYGSLVYSRSQPGDRLARVVEKPIRREISGISRAQSNESVSSNAAMSIDQRTPSFSYYV